MNGGALGKSIEDSNAVRTGLVEGRWVGVPRRRGVGESIENAKPIDIIGQATIITKGLDASADEGRFGETLNAAIQGFAAR